MQNEIFQGMVAGKTRVICPDKDKCGRASCAHNEEHTWGRDEMPRCHTSCDHYKEHIGCFPEGKKPIQSTTDWPTQNTTIQF
jgi:hypothetical protein